MFVIFAAMTQFTVPFAVPSMQAVIGIPLAIAFIGGTRWGLKHLVTCIQIACGAKPGPPKIPSQSYVLTFPQAHFALASTIYGTTTERIRARGSPRHSARFPCESQEDQASPMESSS
jgi:hypothetical protein